jgi:hypothetical protein
VGRDAGKLVVATGSAVLEGGIAGDVFQGERQCRRRRRCWTATSSRSSPPRSGAAGRGQYQAMFDKRTGVLQHALSAVMDEVRLTRLQDGIAAGLDVAGVLPAGRGQAAARHGLAEPAAVGRHPPRRERRDHRRQRAAGGRRRQYHPVRQGRGHQCQPAQPWRQHCRRQRAESDRFAGHARHLRQSGRAPGTLVLADGVTLDASGLFSKCCAIRWPPPACLT